MADSVGKIALDLILNDNNIRKAIKDCVDDAADEVEKGAGEVEGKMSSMASSVGSKLGGIAKAAGAAVAAGTAAVAAGLTAISKSAIEAYADTEQLTGGIETLFGAGGMELDEYAESVGKSVAEAEAEYNNLIAAQDEVMKNAKKAFKDAGLSANEYMEQSTSMAAALVSSLGGDTMEAAKKADMAITDMADNANKMGTDLESLQNAYSGFSKGQFNMLDNLKLGYGGNKTEMERLLADAEKLSGIHYDIDSYADIVDAIHVVQTEMGITGTTAKEATETISGSIGMLKGSWTNFLAGLGDPAADVEQLANDVVESLTYVIQNIAPVLQRVFKALPKALKALGKAAIDTLLPVISELIPELGTILSEMIPEAISAITAMLPTLINAGIDIILALVSGVSQSAPDIITAVINGINAVIDMLPTLIPQLLEAGITLFLALVDAIPSVIQSLSVALPQIIQAIVTVLTDAVPELILAGIDLLTAIIEDLPTIINNIVSALPDLISGLIDGLLDHIPEIIDAGIELLTAIIDNIPAIVLNIARVLPDLIIGINTALLSHTPELIEAGFKLFTALTEDEGRIIITILKLIPQIIDSILDGIFNQKNLTAMAEAGYNLLTGLWSGIKNAMSWLKEKVLGIGPSIVSWAKETLEIGSPSRLMADEIGKWIPRGLAVGIDANMGSVEDAAEGMKDALTGELNMRAIGTITRGATPALAAVNTTGADTTQTDSASLLTAIQSLGELLKAAMANKGDGNITIPVILDGNMLDQIIVRAQQRQVVRTGGV